MRAVHERVRGIAPDGRPYAANDPHLLRWVHLAELDSFLAFSLRGQYDFQSGLYLYAAPSYARAEFTASAGGVSVSEDDWEFGIGGGAGYKFTDQFWGEVSYESYDGTDAFSLGFKVAF